MRFLPWAACAAALSLSLPGGPRAEVVSSAEGHFVIRQRVETSVSPQRAWKALTSEIDKWWSSEHTWSGDARNLSLDPRPGGCFCEKLPGGGVRHMEVVYVKPSELLRLEGGLGPLQEQALTGEMTWRLAAAASGAAVEVTYRVAGHADGGLTTWAPLVDSVLALQAGRLGAFLDTGNPDAKAP